MYYNKEVFKAAGLDPEKPPQTYKELGADCDKIKAAGKECIVLGAKDWAFLWTWLELSVQTCTPADMKALQDRRPEMDRRLPSRGAENLRRHDQARLVQQGRRRHQRHARHAGLLCRQQGRLRHDHHVRLHELEVVGREDGLRQVRRAEIPGDCGRRRRGRNAGPIRRQVQPLRRHRLQPDHLEQAPEGSSRVHQVHHRPEFQTRYLVEAGAMPANKNIDRPSIAKIGSPQLVQTLAWINAGGNFPGSTHLYLYAAEWDQLERGAQLLLSGSGTVEDMAAALQAVHDAQAAKQ